MAKQDHGRDLTAEEMAQMIDEFVNSAGLVKMQKVAEYLTTRVHRTLQQASMKLFMTCIREWAKQTNYDGRNEATIKMAKRIVEAVGENDYLPHI